MDTGRRTRRRWLRVLVEILGWCALGLAAIAAGLVISVMGLDRCGGDWLFGTTEPDLGCYAPWQLASWAPGVAVAGALFARVLTVARRNRAALRTALVGHRPDGDEAT